MLRAVLILAGSLLFALPLPARAQLPAQGLFSRTNLVAWCIVPFDSRKRTPEERAEMLERLGISRLAYDWRSEHIPTFDAEVAALRKHGIELTAWWFPAALNDDAKAILACLERNHLNPQLWVTLSTESETNPARLAQKIDDAVKTLGPVCSAAQRLGSSVALYNHLGWFGEPTNQLAVLQRLRAAGHTNVGSVYNFHHAHAHIDDFDRQLALLEPYLLAINLNGMVRDGDQSGKKIIPLSTGDEELRMLQILNASGWKGPVGLIGHTEEDAEVKLRKELAGLEKLAPQASQSPAPRTTRSAGEPPSSGREPGVQGEKDWLDNRWQQTDVGRFLASTLYLPEGTLRRALSVKVGNAGEGAMAYDLDTGAVRAAWTGGFLRFDPSRFGLIGAIRPEGTLAFSSLSPAPNDIRQYQYVGLHNVEAGPVLEFRIGGTRILEHPSFQNTSVGPMFVRTFWIGPRKEPLSLQVAGHTAGLATGSHVLTETKDGRSNSRMLGWNTLSGVRSAYAVTGLDQYSSTSGISNEGGRESLNLPAGEDPLVLSVHLWRGPETLAKAFEEVAKSLQTGASPQSLAQAGPAHWPTLTTQGQRGADTDFLAVDTLTLPYDNPFKALLFASGVDFGSDGAAYVSTMHGDVWRVSGIDDSLKNLKWQRFATGLYQPLGLKVRDGKVYVLGRDRITRLHDTNNDGEADFYESFFDGINTSTGGHDYVTCLEQDDAGNFYYVDPLGLHQVSADGKSQQTLASGFRNPNGMGVRPDGKVLTAAPQQGTWTPSSGIWEIGDHTVGLYGGYGGPKVTPTRPLGYDAPLCWIPHGVDNYSGSQVWIPEGAWGPLGGQMLHLLWGRCGMMLVLRDTDGSNGSALQGGVVPLPAKFLSGPNRATFNPQDGALYVAGSTGWQTSAVKDGALHRVRYTGKRAALPVGLDVRPDGLELRFSVPLDRSTAEDPGSYGIKQWNYRYAEAYGSKDWSVAHPETEGRDDVAVRSAKLGADGRSVFLEIPGLKPVMQMELKYNVDAADGGKPLRGQFWLTVNDTAKR